MSRVAAWQRWLWRLLTLLAILFAAGISGAWLSEQMRHPLPAAWGWFGAGIAGVAIFGGVSLAIQGQRRGWALIATGGAAEVWFSIQFFGPEHDPLTALILGIYPTLIAIMGGVVETTAQTQERREMTESEQRAWERQQAEKEAERAHALKLAQLEARTRIKLAESTLSDHDRPRPATHGHDDRPWPDTDRPAADKRTVMAWMTEQGPAITSVTGQQLADLFGISERTGRRWLAEYRANGNGQSRR